MPLFFGVPSSVALAVAPWTGTRFYAVDYDGGSDANPGYSDVSMADAGTAPLKTLEKLRSVFPRFGNGQKVVIAIKARSGGASYRNIANTLDDELQLVGVTGYQHVLVRGTGTVATAGAVAFANDAADKVALGGQIFAGTNAPGYNPSGAPTTSVFDCVLAGGGAPGLAAEPALLGKRIRFDSATATVALRNICRMIYQNDTDTITVESNLPATPGLTDVFYIEEPAVSVDRIQISAFEGASQALQPSSLVNGLSIAGIKMPNTGGSHVAFLARSIQTSLEVAFCDAYSTGTLVCNFGQIDNPILSASYTDEVDVTQQPGAGMVSTGWGGTLANSQAATMTACVSRAGRWQFLNISGPMNVGSGCFMGLGIFMQNCLGAGATTGITGGNLIGNAGSTTTRRLRLTSGFSSACMSLTNVNAFIRGVDIQNAGANALIQIRNIGGSIAVNDVVGSTGNTGVGLDTSESRDTRIVLGLLNVNTFTATAGQDIRGGLGGTFYVHADYARTNLVDNNGNKFQGTASIEIGPAGLVANDTAVNVGQYAITRATATQLVTSARANNLGNSSGIVGVSQQAFTAAPVQTAMIVVSGNTWVQFDAVPAAGNIAYLSTATAGNAQVAIPASTGNNQKVRLGRVLRVLGTLGLISFNPDVLPINADGAA